MKMKEESADNVCVDPERADGHEGAQGNGVAVRYKGTPALYVGRQAPKHGAKITGGAREGLTT